MKFLKRMKLKRMQKQADRLAENSVFLQRKGDIRGYSKLVEQHAEHLIKIQDYKNTHKL